MTNSQVNKAANFVTQSVKVWSHPNSSDLRNSINITDEEFDAANKMVSLVRNLKESDLLKNLITQRIFLLISAADKSTDPDFVNKVYQERLQLEKIHASLKF